MAMPATGGEPSSGYAAELARLLTSSFAPLLRPSSHPQARDMARALAWQALWLIAIGAVVIVTMMLIVDVTEIGLMPPRGTPSVRPFRVITDFGKDVHVLGALAALWVIVVLLAPAMRGIWRPRLQRLAIDVQFMFFAVLVPVLAGDVIKWIVGRGRPFVGGAANAFNFAPFKGTEAYSSFPSGHCITAAALAFAVAALWPRISIVAVIYALLIIASRLVLLAHHPSDVTAGALVGIAGAMLVRYWFAVRGLGFAITDDGAIERPVNPVI
jgi:membrane-associated phospholipid phosphatase